MELDRTVSFWPQKILHIFKLNDEVMLPGLATTVYHGCAFKDDLIDN